MNDCQPTCAGGTFHDYPIEITLGAVVNSDLGYPLFSRAAVFYTAQPPPGDNPPIYFELQTTRNGA